MRFKKLIWFAIVVLGGSWLMLELRPAGDQPPQAQAEQVNRLFVGLNSTGESQSRVRFRLQPGTLASPNITPTDYATEIEKVLESEDQGERDQVLGRLISEWVAQDPTATAYFVTTIQVPLLRDQITRRVIQAWAAADPAAAITWAAGLADPWERETALSYACNQVSTRDPREALQLAMEQHLEDASNGLVETLTTRWAEQDFSAASDWVSHWPAGERRNELMARIAFVQSQTDPIAAARLVTEQMETGDLQIEAAVSIVHQWALRDSQGALAWVQQFPEGPVRERAMNELSGIAQYKLATAN